MTIIWCLRYQWWRRRAPLFAPQLRVTVGCGRARTDAIRRDPMQAATAPGDRRRHAGANGKNRWSDEVRSRWGLKGGLHGRATMTDHADWGWQGRGLALSAMGGTDAV